MTRVDPKIAELKASNIFKSVRFFVRSVIFILPLLALIKYVNGLLSNVLLLPTLYRYEDIAICLIVHLCLVPIYGMLTIIGHKFISKYKK